MYFLVWLGIDPGIPPDNLCPDPRPRADFIRWAVLMNNSVRHLLKKLHESYYPYPLQSFIEIPDCGVGRGDQKSSSSLSVVIAASPVLSFLALRTLCAGFQGYLARPVRSLL